MAIRYRHPAYPASLAYLDQDRIKITFTETQRAITPGQMAVIYQGEELLGCGVIDQVL